MPKFVKLGNTVVNIEQISYIQRVNEATSRVFINTFAGQRYETFFDVNETIDSIEKKLMEQ